MTHDSERTDSDEQAGGGPFGITRRDLMAGLGAFGVAGALGYADFAGPNGPINRGNRRVLSPDRFEQVYEYREEQAAKLLRGVPVHPVVDDVNDGADGYLERFTRGLPHNTDLTVDDDVYETYLEALAEGGNDAWEDVERGGSRPFIDPSSSTTMPILGADTHEIVLDNPPEIGSETVAADMVDLYYISLLRDVPFSEYAGNDIVEAAINDLNQFSEEAYVTPRDENGEITPNLLFRGPLPGSELGPKLSQFMLQPAPFGAHDITQDIRVAEPGIDFIDDRATLLSDRDGTSFDGGEDGTRAISNPDEQVFDDQNRFMRTLRDVSSCVQRDVVPGQFLIAVMIVLDRPVDGVPPNPAEVYDSNNPEIEYESIHTFVDYARTHILDLMTRAGRLALMAAWFNKWQVHRRARPSKLAGMLDLTFDEDIDVDYSDMFNESLNDVEVFRILEEERGNHLLTSAYAEGEPFHPSYPGGHAVVASAVATIGKAMLNEDYVVDNPVRASADGTSLEPYEGDDAGELTVGGELNKLVDNINILGRQGAGVHYRSDYVGRRASYHLGEQVGIRLLEDVRDQTDEMAPFEFTSFSGSRVRI